MENRPFIEDVMREKNFRPEYKNLSEDGVRLFLQFTTSSEVLQHVLKSKEYKDQFFTEILDGRINTFELQEKVKHEALISYIVFELNNPAKVILLLIRLLEFYEKNKRAAGWKDIVNIFPMGFYDDNTCRFIIENCLKTRKTINSEIYISK